MKVHYRQRRPYGSYGTYSPQPQSGKGGTNIARIVLLLLLLWLAWMGIRAFLGLFGGGGIPQTAALTVEARSNVDVSYGGGEFQPAETATKLQPGDAVRTGPDSHAVLQLADGTLMRLDQRTEGVLSESARRKDTLTEHVTLREGSVWVLTPSAASGTSVRLVSIGNVSYRLPTNTEAFLSPTGAVVYAADGYGVEVLRGKDVAVTLGEGQQLKVPNGSLPSDLASLRSAFNLAALRNTFVQQSRRLLAKGAQGNDDESGSGLLSITSPTNNQELEGSTVHLSGRVDPSIKEVRVNGAAIPLAADGSFSRDFPVLNETDAVLHITALDAQGTIVEETTRTVTKRDSSASSQATAGATAKITEPAKAGETYRTTDAEVVIRGTVPTGTQLVYVNDYLLKLFDPAKGTFSYLARLDLGNMKPGVNTYDIVAVDASGKRTSPARLTILQGAGATMSAASSAASTSSVPRLNNPPLTPGVIQVTAPAEGQVQTGTGFLMEGTTSKDTVSMEVNGYRLQLFKPNGGYWNYIAALQYANLKPGTNTYVIVARNSKGQVLDRLTYKVEFQR